MCSVSPSYAVTWREPRGPVFAGKLELGPAQLRLEGASPHGRRSTQSLRYDDLVSVRVARGSDDRVDGRPVVLVERRNGGPLRIASVGGVGLIAEVASRLATVTAANGRT